MSSSSASEHDARAASSFFRSLRAATPLWPLVLSAFSAPSCMAQLKFLAPCAVTRDSAHNVEKKTAKGQHCFKVGTDTQEHTTYAPGLYRPAGKGAQVVQCLSIGREDSTSPRHTHVHTHRRACITRESHCHSSFSSSSPIHQQCCSLRFLVPCSHSSFQHIYFTREPRLKHICRENAVDDWLCKRIAPFLHLVNVVYPNVAGHSRNPSVCQCTQKQ